MCHITNEAAHRSSIPRAFAALDPLSADEIRAVTSMVRAAPQFAAFGSRWRFITIALREPTKHALLALRELSDATSAPREAEVVLLDHGSGIAHEVVVSLTGEALLDWRERPGVQPLATVDELGEAEELVRLDPEFRAALKLRGVTEIEKVQIDAWPAGNFGHDDEAGLRLARCVAFVRDRPGD